jgi:radical SAM-linked protein
MVRQRARIRFRKEHDLRLISHRDLARAMERLFRRAELPLRMSEGYHPKPRMSFPSALALGIEGLDEVMEVELTEHLEPAHLLGRLNAQAPQGLAFTTVELRPGNEKKAQVGWATYRVDVPRPYHELLQRKMEELSRQPAWRVPREGRDEPIDVKAALDHMELRDGVLQFRLALQGVPNVRPREVLRALDIDDLEDRGNYLARAKVELMPCGTDDSSRKPGPSGAEQDEA